MRSIVSQVSESFYWRNLFLVLILTSVYAGSRSTSSDFNSADILIAYLFAAWAYIAYMFHNMVLYEELLKPKRYFFYILSFIVLLIVFRWGHLELTAAFQKLWIRLTYRGWLALYWADAMYFMLALSVYLAFTYAREKERLLKVENEKKELELAQLNQQLNPHFLFNALNNIYAHLMVGNNNGKELILKLSELMRYILDSSSKKLVPLQEEIGFIENYLAFSKERLGARCDIRYTKTIKPDNAQIVPLILFTFIENAFKHGTKRIGHATINIDLNVADNSIKLNVSNPVSGSDEPGTQTGLKNTRERLAILYPDSYTLNTQTTDGIYIVSLEIKML